ncbi:hypothetical protein [Natrinema sp. DC36]|uniref:hypothetical protein n=1 Tax=Natrinema sp. DC36 TaxID=2878680 RepID=UPI001CF03F4F|nr:hypothetical protein [Natrinema sp. DC36]
MNLKMAHEPNDADGLILNTLTEGRNSPQNLADKLDYSRQYVQNRLQLLNAAEFVENIGGGLYELTDKGRDEIGAPERDQLETVADALDEIEAAFERGDPDAARAALERAQEAISDSDIDD